MRGLGRSIGGLYHQAAIHINVFGGLHQLAEIVIIFHDGFSLLAFCCDHKGTAVAGGQDKMLPPDYNCFFRIAAFDLKFGRRLFQCFVNQSFIDVERAYKKELSDMTVVLLDQMRARNMSIAPAIWESAPPPMHEVSLFRTWLAGKYKERDSLLMKEVVVPEDPINLGDVPNWDDVRKEDLPGILRCYRMSCEVFTALAQASANVRYVAKVKDEKGEIQAYDSEAEMNIISIESLRFDETRPAPAANCANVLPSTNSVV